MCKDHHSYTLKNPTRNHTSDGTVVTPGQTASTILNGKMQRPASQATSVKAEPGSSVASASVKRVSFCYTISIHYFSIRSIILLV